MPASECTREAVLVETGSPLTQSLKRVGVMCLDLDLTALLRLHVPRLRSQWLSDRSKRSMTDVSLNE